MKNILKILTLGLSLMSSCALYKPQASKNDFEMVRYMHNPNPPYMAIFVDRGKIGQLDKEDFLFVNNSKEILIYSWAGVFNENMERIDFCRKYHKDFIKEISTQYFNNLKDFEAEKNKETK